MLRVGWKATLKLDGHLDVDDEITLIQLREKMVDAVEHQLGWIPKDDDLTFGPITVKESV